MVKNNFFYSTSIKLTLAIIFTASILFTQNSATAANIDQKVNALRLNKVATIQILNKVTAKASILELPLKEKKQFGQLEIIAHKCWSAALDQKPENKILLEVLETQSDGESKRIFYGWMFSSSPSISDLENPVYDIRAIECKN